MFFGYIVSLVLVSTVGSDPSDWVWQFKFPHKDVIFPKFRINFGKLIGSEINIALLESLPSDLDENELCDLCSLVCNCQFLQIQCSKDTFQKANHAISSIVDMCFSFYHIYCITTDGNDFDTLASMEYRNQPLPRRSVTLAFSNEQPQYSIQLVLEKANAKQDASCWEWSFKFPFPCMEFPRFRINFVDLAKSKLSITLLNNLEDVASLSSLHRMSNFIVNCNAFQVYLMEEKFTVAFNQLPCILNKLFFFSQFGCFSASGSFRIVRKSKVPRSTIEMVRF